MHCPGCGTENPPSAKFCVECGAPLQRSCTSCGAAAPPTACFCPECGTALVASADGPGAPQAPGPAPARTPPPSGSAQVPVSERRLVSVLFCDLVGFTTLSEARDAEEVRELLSSYFDVARTVIARYGGVVEKFIGDAVMAVWGVPVSNEDDAERAVRAALELVAAIEMLGHDLGIQSLSARAGVLSGEAAVNLAALGEGMVAGDLVNTASRLQSAAGAGQVLVGEATYLAARDAISFEEVGELILKGKAEPLTGWRALRVVGQRKGAGKSEAIEPPFVGRDEELRLLVELLHATAREHTVRLVSVTGMAGIGKSRLAWELQKYVDGLADDVYWHQGRSPAYGEGVTFFALAEMVRMRCGIAEGEDEEHARKKLAATLAEFVFDEAERGWVEPRLAYLLALGDAPAGDHQELMSAWRTFFERIADKAPVVMVFEDIHWADAGLLDYVESIAEWSRNFPIFVCTLARPELKERRPTWGTAVRHYTSMHLDPLGDDAMAALVSGLVPGLPDDAAERLVARAEGIPLYAVETVRTLADRGALQRGATAYEVCGDVTDIELPETLHALIASRIDALGQEARALVLDAAVVGKTFTLAALAAVSGQAQEELAPVLAELVHREVLTLDRDPRSPERGQYGFLQAVVREVAYATLSKPDRRAKHLAAAHHFESLHDDELAGVVATHYLEAHRTSRPGPEADAVAAKARDWLGEACARARSLGSSEEALSYAEEALGIAAPGPERAALLVLAGETALDAAEHERALGYLEEAIAYAEAEGDPVSRGRATAWLVLALERLGRIAEAIERGEDAFRALSDAEGPAAADARARLAERLSWACRSSGEPARGLEWAEHALTFAEQLDDQELLSEALGARGGSLFVLGRHREASALMAVELELAVAAGSLRQQATAKTHEFVVVLDDDPRRALEASSESAELARRAGAREVEINSLLNAAESAIHVGDWDAAGRILFELGGRRLHEPMRDVWRWNVAVIEGLQGDPARALESLAATAATGETAEYVDLRTTYHKVRALVHLAAGNFDQAFGDAAAVVALDPAGINSAHALSIQAHAALWAKDLAGAQAALSGMEQFRGRWMRAARRTTEAGVAALEGRVSEAVTAYGEAAAAWRALRTPFDFALCGLDAAFLLPEQDRPNDLVAAAREELSLMGAAPFLALAGQRTRGGSADPAMHESASSITS
jgi:class 3 adenylate cyclase/tetratricopeptide (TPR) repeat protein